MHKGFILLLALHLIGHWPAAAQTPAPPIVLAQEHVAPIIAVLPTVSTPLLAASFALSRAPGKSTGHFSVPFGGPYECDYSLKNLSPMDEVKTLFLTQSSMPLVQLWGGRVQLDAFQSTQHIPNVQISPFGNGGMQGSRLSPQRYPGGPRSVSLSGLSLSFQCGRETRTERPAQLWRRLTQIVGTILN